MFRRHRIPKDTVHEPARPLSPEERRSTLVFGGFLGLILLACFFPQMPAQGLYGLLWVGLGTLMLLRPPEVRVPWLWPLCAFGFVLAAMAGFLPREWFAPQPWRSGLEALGLDTGTRAYIQPGVAVETLLGFAMTALAGVFLLGHRVGTRVQHHFMLGFASAVGLWTLAALLFHQADQNFGFFPNRNHTATLLSMGAFAGLGALAQAVRFKEGWKITLAVPLVLLCLITLFAVSTSRAGIVLVTIGILVWLPLTGLRQLRGNAGRAIMLLLLAFSGLFLILDSEVKDRLTDTAERFQKPGAALPTLLTTDGQSPGTPVTPVAPTPPVSPTPPTAPTPQETPSTTPGGASAPAPETTPPALSPPPVPVAPVKPNVAFDSTHTPEVTFPVDGRMLIYEDTWNLIQNENWTGVGPGSFERVYPHYRDKLGDLNDSDCLHPESDWLLMIAEAGWPATLCLLAGVLAVAATAIWRAWPSGARPLRMGGIVGALLICLHGMFDVPGHRVGLAWAAFLLMAISLRPVRKRKSYSDPLASGLVRTVWRAVGVLPLLAGLVLLQAQWRDAPLLPSAKVRKLLDEAQALYDADAEAYQKATAEGRDYQPTPEEDLLEKALVKVGQAIEVAPFDYRLHGIRGALALHFDDKTELIDRSYAIERALVPTRVKIPMVQARGWLVQNPLKAVPLWREAMERAAADEKRFPQTRFGPLATYQEILAMARNHEALCNAALELAGQDVKLLLPWTSVAPAKMLNEQMIKVLPEVASLEARIALFRSWQKYGDPKKAQEFAEQYPQLGLAFN